MISLKLNTTFKISLIGNISRDPTASSAGVVGSNTILIIG